MSPEVGRNEANSQTSGSTGSGSIARVTKSVLDEVGVVHLWQASSDVHLLIATRFVRLLAFGQVSLVLVMFFKAIGIDEDRTGFFMAATLVGDMLISFLLTMFADRLGRRATLLWGSSMMALAGATFALSSNYYLLLLAAVVGVISPSGGEIGPFRAVEESMLAHLVSYDARADIFAWYTLLSSLGAAFGSMSGGWILQVAQTKYGLTDAASYRVLFWSYTILGALKTILTALLSAKTEIDVDREARLESESASETASENQPLLDGNRDRARQAVGTSGQESSPSPQKQDSSRFARLLPHFSPESRRIVLLLSMLFAIDSFGSSLATFSWTTYYVSRKFDVGGGTLGTIFFTSGVIASFATLGGASIAKRLGPVLTMFVTHLPASVMLALLPAPRTLVPTLILLWVRASVGTMDVVPRQVFLSSVVLKTERTAVMGWVNVIKTCSQIFGPAVTGYFAKVDKQWIAFVLAGTLKSIYDLCILFTFMRVNLNRDND